nr:glycosyltransferase family 39 protein [Actinomadura rugatobispora]
MWRSPDGQPPWARPALLAVAAVAGLLFSWNLHDAGYAPLYSVVAKSMSMSWKAFLFGAVDPAATSTVDKLAGSFVFQALSVRIFGFHEWSLALPQAIEGVITVLVMYRVVRRWQGPAAGLLAAGLLGLTPIVTSMFGHSMEDGALTMFLVLAADCYQRAVNEARPRSLVLAGVWIGLGFQCKMLQAWMVVPALALGYLLVADVALRRRIRHLLIAGAALIVVSASWTMLFVLTPAADRPYVDGTTNDKALSMVFGYNGLDRLGIMVPGTLRGAGSQDGGNGPATQSKGTDPNAPGAPSGQDGGTSQGGGPGNEDTGGPGTHEGGGPGGKDDRGPGTTSGTADSGPDTAPGTGPDGAAPRAGTSESSGGWTKLLRPDIATQTGWLYPAALLSLGLGLVWHRRAGRTDRTRGGYLMWGTWFALSALVFSKIDVSHKAYLATLSVSIAALAAAGIVAICRAHRAGGRRAWALPVLVAAELAWTIHLSRDYPSFLPWLVPLVSAVGGAALVVLVVALVKPWARPRMVTAALVAGVGAVLLTPTVWAASVLDSRYAGDSFEAGAGPGNHREPGSHYELTGHQRALLRYTRAHARGADHLFATTSFDTASTFIAGAGAKVLPIGGFRGSVPAPTLSRIKELVADGDLRFILVGGSADIGYSGTPITPTVNDVIQWTRSACTPVPESSYAGAGAAQPNPQELLYDCGNS